MQGNLFDMVHVLENNRESKMILEANRERLENQCAKVLRLFREGKRLTVLDAMVNHGIGDLRRRVKDLKESGFTIQSKMIGHGYKEYWISGT